MSNLASKERCSGAYPAVWRFLYSHEVCEREWVEGTGESESTGRMVTIEGQYDVVALTQGFAIEAYKMEHPASIYTLRSGPEFICFVDAMIGVSKNYGGHFS